MIKILALAFFLLSCSQSSNNETSNKTYYAYGLEALPGILTALDFTYRPVNLSEKKIILGDKSYLPMDFKDQELTLSFDAATGITSAISVIKFQQSQDSYPYFELLNPLSSITLDGSPVASITLNDPEGQKRTYIAVDSEVAAGAIHELIVLYELGPNKVTFSNGGVGFLTHMTDLEPSNFFETWGPVGFEHDSFRLNLNLKILNSSAEHNLFTNGEALKFSSHEWKVEFPDYYTRSSFYIHLTNQQLIQKSFVYKGFEKDIPVTVYGPTSGLVDQASELLPSYFQEYENDYGPYAHNSFTAYMHAGGGGMEYAGATITSIGALDHELFHSWFARGVIPADGRSGWIDEAFASWRDYGYFQAGSLLSRNPTNLSAFSAFRESTPRNCYVDGRNLIAELDRVFSQYGGMKPLMKLFFHRYKRKAVTNEEFWQFLSTISGLNIDAYFQRYTLGGVPSFNLMNAKMDSKHPLPLSSREIEALR